MTKPWSNDITLTTNWRRNSKIRQKLLRQDQTYKPYGISKKIDACGKKFYCVLLIYGNRNFILEFILLALMSHAQYHVSIICIHSLRLVQMYLQPGIIFNWWKNLQCWCNCTSFFVHYKLVGLSLFYELDMAIMDGYPFFIFVYWQNIWISPEFTFRGFYIGPMLGIFVHYWRPLLCL